jgi:hypothetical protein
MSMSGEGFMQALTEVGVDVGLATAVKEESIRCDQTVIDTDPTSNEITYVQGEQAS